MLLHVLLLPLRLLLPVWLQLLPAEVPQTMSRTIPLPGTNREPEQ